MYITLFVPEVDPEVEAENKRLKEEKIAKKALEKDLSPLPIKRRTSLTPIQRQDSLKNHPKSQPASPRGDGQAV